jgi:hypothetical protein
MSQNIEITKISNPKFSNLKIHKGIEITKEERENWT